MRYEGLGTIVFILSSSWSTSTAHSIMRLSCRFSDAVGVYYAPETLRCQDLIMLLHHLYNNMHCQIYSISDYWVYSYSMRTGDRVSRRPTRQEEESQCVEPELGRPWSDIQRLSRNEWILVHCIEKLSGWECADHYGMNWQPSSTLPYSTLACPMPSNALSTHK